MGLEVHGAVEKQRLHRPPFPASPRPLGCAASPCHPARGGGETEAPPTSLPSLRASPCQGRLFSAGCVDQGCRRALQDDRGCTSRPPALLQTPASPEQATHSTRHATLCGAP